jgi:hypothetical protein
MFIPTQSVMVAFDHHIRKPDFSQSFKNTALYLLPIIGEKGQNSAAGVLL